MCEYLHQYLCTKCLANAWKGQMTLAHLELKFKGAVSCYVGAGTEPRSSTKAASAVNH